MIEPCRDGVWRFMPGVQVISVSSGDTLDIVYRKDDTGWVATLPGVLA